jgi:hypothetical protein
LCGATDKSELDRTPLSFFLAMDDLEHEVSMMGALPGITIKSRVEVISLSPTLPVLLLHMVFSVHCVRAK